MRRKARSRGDHGEPPVRRTPPGIRPSSASCTSTSAACPRRSIRPRSRAGWPVSRRSFLGEPLGVVALLARRDKPRRASAGLLQPRAASELRRHRDGGVAGLGLLGHLGRPSRPVLAGAGAPTSRTYHVEDLSSRGRSARRRRCGRTGPSRASWPVVATGHAFQKPKAQCALNAAMPQRMPSYSKCGMPHLIVSTTSGQPAMHELAQMWRRIGRANGAPSRCRRRCADLSSPSSHAMGSGLHFSVFFGVPNGRHGTSFPRLGAAGCDSVPYP